MHKWLNIEHVTFNMMIAGSPGLLIGKMISADANGFTVLQDGTGEEHGYTWHVLEHVSHS